MEFNEDDYLMLSGIQHYVFCKRQWALIHIEQQWNENYQTTAGMLMHENAHDETNVEHRKNVLIVRGLRISSRTLGVTGQCDVVEFHKDKKGISLQGEQDLWRVVPVEYKRGIPKENEEDVMQLCLQAMCLEEMFVTQIREGFMYYGEKKRRTKVEFTEELRSNVLYALNEMHQLYRRGYTPKVKVTKQCKSCSLANLCLPKIQKESDVSAYIRKYVGEGEDDV